MSRTRSLFVYNKEPTHGKAELSALPCLIHSDILHLGLSVAAKCQLDTHESQLGTFAVCMPFFRNLYSRFENFAPNIAVIKSKSAPQTTCRILRADTVSSYMWLELPVTTNTLPNPGLIRNLDNHYSTVSVGPAGLDSSLDCTGPWAPAQPNQIDRTRWRVSILATGPVDRKDRIK